MGVIFSDTSFTNYIVMGRFPSVYVSNFYSSKESISISRQNFEQNVCKNGTTVIKMTSSCHFKLMNAKYFGKPGSKGAVIDIRGGTHVAIVGSTFANNAASRYGDSAQVRRSYFVIKNFVFKDN